MNSSFCYHNNEVGVGMNARSVSKMKYGVLSKTFVKHSKFFVCLSCDEISTLQWHIFQLSHTTNHKTFKEVIFQKCNTFLPCLPFISKSNFLLDVFVIVWTRSYWKSNWKVQYFDKWPTYFCLDWTSILIVFIHQSGLSFWGRKYSKYRRYA